MKEILSPCSLREKRDQISLFLVNGDSTLYFGGVSWTLSMPENDRAVKGTADSADAAFIQIRNVIEELMKRADPAAKALLTIEGMEP